MRFYNRNFQACAHRVVLDNKGWMQINCMHREILGIIVVAELSPSELTIKDTTLSPTGLYFTFVQKLELP